MSWETTRIDKDDDTQYLYEYICTVLWAIAVSVVWVIMLFAIGFAYMHYIAEIF